MSNRKQIFFVAISPSGRNGLGGRMLKSMPRLERDEVALQLTVELPDAIFKKPSLSASVVVPEGTVKGPVIDATVVDNIRAVVSRELGVNLSIAPVEPTRVNGEWRQFAIDRLALGPETVAELDAFAAGSPPSAA